MAKYLDENGLRYLWSKIKSYVASKSGVTTLQVYPVGAIYMSVNATSPATLFGGTWEAIAKGQFLVGVNADDADFTAGKTGGVKTNSLSHAHTVNNHTHSMGHTHTVDGHTHGMGHTHTVNDHSHSMGHTHTVNSHDHEMSHTHTVNSHAHSTANHTLTIAEMPSHTHSYGTSASNSLAAPGGSHGTAYNGGSYLASYTGGGAGHNHGNTGASAPGTSTSSRIYTLASAPGTGQASATWTGGSTPGTSQASSTSTGSASPGTGQPSSANTGGAAPGTSAALGTINNLPPYLACYMWKRTA